MQPIHKKILAFGLVFILALATVLQVNRFTTFPGGGWFYICCAGISMPLLGWFFGSFFSRNIQWLTLGSLLALEIFLSWILHTVADGKRLPLNLVRMAQYIYGYHCGVNIVFQPGMGRYDERLFYTLQPGVHTFSNFEFSTTYHVNKAGFRDDDASLQSPEIVFLGDSYGMGWGVEQGETIAETTGKLLGKQVLNAGISSYGTARELVALQNFQLDSCRLVVIQFCDNDTTENRSFVASNFRLKVSPPAVFKDGQRWNEVSAYWFPFKYCHAVFAWAVRKMTKESARLAPRKTDGETIPPGGIPQQGVVDFFAILEKIKAHFKGEVIVFNIGLTKTTPAVFEQFSSRLAEHPVPGVHLFPSHEHLSEASYFRLDNHLNATGHRQLGEALTRFILERKLMDE